MRVAKTEGSSYGAPLFMSSLRPALSAVAGAEATNEQASGSQPRPTSLALPAAPGAMCIPRGERTPSDDEFVSAGEETPTSEDKKFFTKTEQPKKREVLSDHDRSILSIVSDIEGNYSRRRQVRGGILSRAMQHTVLNHDMANLHSRLADAYSKAKK